MNYSLTLLPRNNRRRWGFGILTKKYLVIIEYKHIPLYLSECIRLSVTLCSINFTFFLIYRPPNTNILPFFNDFTEIIDSINNTNFRSAGDFNFHFGNPFPPHYSFCELPDSLSLIQNVNFPTQISCNTLDLIVNPILNNVIYSKPSVYSFSTDHYTIKLSHNATSLPTTKSIIIYH